MLIIWGKNQVNDQYRYNRLNYCLPTMQNPPSPPHTHTHTVSNAHVCDVGFGHVTCWQWDCEWKWQDAITFLLLTSLWVLETTSVERTWVKLSSKQSYSIFITELRARNKYYFPLKFCDFLLKRKWWMLWDFIIMLASWGRGDRNGMKKRACE